MKQHNHEHPGLGGNVAGHHKKSRGRHLHKDWRTWVVVALMLSAMLIYVLTLDDTIVPSGQPGTTSQAPTPALSQP